MLIHFAFFFKCRYEYLKVVSNRYSVGKDTSKLFRKNMKSVISTYDHPCCNLPAWDVDFRTAHLLVYFKSGIILINCSLYTNLFVIFMLLTCSLLYTYIFAKRICVPQTPRKYFCILFKMSNLTFAAPHDMYEHAYIKHNQGCILNCS